MTYDPDLNEMPGIIHSGIERGLESLFCEEGDLESFSCIHCVTRVTENLQL